MEPKFIKVTEKGITSMLNTIYIIRIVPYKEKTHVKTYINYNMDQYMYVEESISEIMAQMSNNENIKTLFGE